MTATNHGEQRLSCASYKAREASPPHLCSCNVGGGGIYLTLRKTLSTHCMHELADVHDWLVSAWSRGERGYAIPHSLRAWPILVWADRNSRVTQITTLYNCRAEKYNMSSLEVDGLQHEKAISGFTPLIHNRNLTLQWTQTHQHWLVGDWGGNRFFHPSAISLQWACAPWKVVHTVLCKY